MKIIPDQVNNAKLFSYLTNSVAPRPIAMVSTIDINGNINLSPFSFFNLFSSNPPILIFSPSRKGKDNTLKHTYLNVKEVGECVVNIVNFNMVQQTSLSSSEYPKGTNEFIKAGFTQIASEYVTPPRIKESPIQFECRVKQIIELGNQGGAGNLVLCEIIAVHIQDNILDEHQNIDPNKLQLVGRMGGNWYSKAFGEALFEVEKPSFPIGIGIDAIPQEIRASNFLTGNDLGKLGNIAQLPNETDVNEYKLMELSELFLLHQENAKTLEQEIHKKAHYLLQENRVEEAWKCLLSFNN